MGHCGVFKCPRGEVLMLLYDSLHRRVPLPIPNPEIRPIGPINHAPHHHLKMAWEMAESAELTVRRTNALAVTIPMTIPVVLSALTGEGHSV